MFNPQFVTNAPEGGVAMLEVVGDERTHLPFVPLRHVEISGEVTGPVAGMQIVHVFGYTKAQCSKVLEAVYRFPLPGDAAVTGVSVRFGDTEIQTVLEPRAQAEKEYRQAKKDRRQAALVTREAPDVFTLLVAGINPGQDVTVETAFVQLARAEGTGWSLRLPLTVAPRYTRWDEHPRAGNVNPLAQATDPGYRATLHLTIVDAAAVSSSTHVLSMTVDGPERHVAFGEGDIVPNSDAVIAWQPVADESRPLLSAFVAHDEQRSSFLALVTPPSGEQQIVPRDLTVLVDHSGSMQGPKWEAADWAVKRLIGMLTEGDHLRLGVFHSKATWWDDVPRSMDAEARADAGRFLESRRDSGGTNLGVALEQALRSPATAGDVARHVLIVTDAEVTDEGRLLRMVQEESKRATRRRISILCVDSSPNEPLAHQLAEAGGGYDWYVTSNPEGEDITTALDGIVDMWARPIAVGLRLEVQPGTVYASSRPLLMPRDGRTVVDLGDLPGGVPLWVAGTTARTDALSLHLVDQVGTTLASWNEAPQQSSHPAVAALVDAHILQKLEAMRGARYDSTQIKDKLAELGIAPAEEGGSTALYPENRAPDDVLARVICRESLRSGIASSETAFIAVRSQAGRSVERLAIIPNAEPEGWEMAQVLRASAPSLRSPFVVGEDERARPMDFVEPLAEEPPAFVANLPARRLLRDSALGIGGKPRNMAQPPRVTLFDGVPAGTGTSITLAERTVGAKGEAGLIAARLTGLAATGDPSAFAPEAVLLLYVGDMARARARVRLADLLGGAERPLNVNCMDGQIIRLVLVPGATAPGHLTVTLGVV